MEFIYLLLPLGDAKVALIHAPRARSNVQNLSVHLIPRSHVARVLATDFGYRGELRSRGTLARRWPLASGTAVCRAFVHKERAYRTNLYPRRFLLRSRPARGAGVDGKGGTCTRSAPYRPARSILIPWPQHLDAQPRSRELFAASRGESNDPLFCQPLAFARRAGVR